MQQEHPFAIWRFTLRTVLVHQHLTELADGNYMGYIRSNRNLRFVKPGKQGLDVPATQVPRRCKLIVVDPIRIHVTNAGAGVEL